MDRVEELKVREVYETIEEYDEGLEQFDYFLESVPVNIIEEEGYGVGLKDEDLDLLTAKGVLKKKTVKWGDMYSSTGYIESYLETEGVEEFVEREMEALDEAADTYSGTVLP